MRPRNPGPSPFEARPAGEHLRVTEGRSNLRQKHLIPISISGAAVNNTHAIITTINKLLYSS